MRKHFHSYRRVVVKVGTSVVTNDDGSFALSRIGHIVEEMANLIRAGKQVIFVSSGSVGLGKRTLTRQVLFQTPLREHVEQWIPDEQTNPGARACAAAGQSQLMSLYQSIFSQSGLECSQILVTDEDLQNDVRRKNLSMTIEKLLQLNVVPIMNENDVVSLRSTPIRDSEKRILWVNLKKKKKLKDNDSLACRISGLLHCDICILLTDVEGIYTQPPKNGRKPVVIHQFSTNKRAQFTLGEKSRVGTGGMRAKIEAAEIAIGEGVRAVIIASGFVPSTISRIMTGQVVGTLFTATPAKEEFTEVSILKAKRTRKAARELVAVGSDCRKQILLEIAKRLMEMKEVILERNREDIREAERSNLELPLLKRLKLTEEKLRVLSDGIIKIAQDRESIGEVVGRTELAKGLVLEKTKVPIGVILVIFESRPDALPQIASLCIKSGNGLLLKGGKEAKRSNRILHNIIQECIVKVSKGKVPKDAVVMYETRKDVKELLSLDDDIDLVIPRGSSKFVKFIQSNTKIPVLGHSEGICHVYVDKDADKEKAIRVVVDSKVDYPAACNAVETVLVHADLSKEFVKHLIDSLKKEKVEIRGGPRASKELGLTKAESLSVEYSAKILTLEIVNNCDEAIDHINTYGSGHTESIVTENKICAERFMRATDSACVFHNVSTRFADGFRFGLGAEVGISTSRIHARGPVGIDGLLTTKWLAVSESSDIVSEYGSGKKKFTHKNVFNSNL